MRHYTPANGGEPAEPEGGSLPFGVKLLAVIAGLVIFVMGAKSVKQDVDTLRKFRNLATAYSPVPAKWLQVGVRQDSSGDDEFYPDVRFEYFVDGESVWGWQLSFEEMPQPRGYWEKRLGKYRAGDTVTAYYNPRRPKDSFESFVEPRHDNLTRYYLKGVVGAAFSLFGAFLFVVPVAGWLKRPRPKK